MKGARLAVPVATLIAAALCYRALVPDLRPHLEAVLGTPLPRDVSHLLIYRLDRDEDLGPPMLYVRGELAEADWPPFAAQLQLDSHSRLLPADWQAPEGRALSWWTAAAETPKLSAARALGATGSAAAKLENGILFMVVVEPTPERFPAPDAAAIRPRR